MKKTTVLLALTLSFSSFCQDQLTGAWGNENSTITFAAGCFSIVEFDQEKMFFGGTKGGIYEWVDDSISLTYEFNTWKSATVGTNEMMKLVIDGDQMKIGDYNYIRLDDGTPGVLRGAWLITGRMRDGEIRSRQPGPRKTMKILSGTRFQWIAYNTETKSFMGTGGGTYTTQGGNYTEYIEFFSRDSTRVGSSLNFQYELKEGKWHHSGKSSKGKDIYEIWSLRKELD